MKRLVLLGAGHVHLKIIHAIPTLRAKGVEVVVVDPISPLYYSGMIAAIVGGTVAHRGGAIATRELVERRGGTFIATAAAEIDAPGRTVTLEDSTRLEWDVVSCALGSRVQPNFPVDEAASSRVVSVKPVIDPARFLGGIEPTVERSENASIHRIAVIGGGASAVEIAGNLRHRFRRRGRSIDIRLYSRGQHLLAAFPRRAGEIARDHLERRGIGVHLGRGVVGVTENAIVFDDGHTAAFDHAVVATGLQAPDIFRRSHLPVGSDGGLIVDETLRVPGLPIFGGGDCISFCGESLPRIGVHAVYQSPVLTRNVFAAAGVTRRRVREYVPPGRVLQIINLGDGYGLAVRGDSTSVGRFWLGLKKRIDWRYVETEGRSIRPSLGAPP